MTDDTLEAQARKRARRLGTRYCRHWNGAYCDICTKKELTAWARRLVAESRAGALREAKPYMKHAGPCVADATLAIVRQRDPICSCGRDALAAEAEPGGK